MFDSATSPQGLSREEIQRIQQDRLQQMLEEVVPRNPFWKTKFHAAGLSPQSIKTVDDLRQLPPTTKAELVEDQRLHLPYGSNLTYGPHDYARMHQTSGTTGSPMRWLDTSASWQWILDCWSQIYQLIGLKREDRLFFPFSFGPFIGFWAAFEGATRLGNFCLAGGGMTSEARLRMLADNGATIVCCTPTYALRLAEVAEQQGIDLVNSTVRALVVAGEPGGSIPATRSRMEAAWGARVFDHWGMTEIASLGIETVARPRSLSLLETECIAEIVDSATLEPVPVGEVGELLITNLGRLGSPLIRYRTGDLVRQSTQPSTDESQLLTLEGGILGRTDDMVTIRGNNVFPSSIEAIIRQFQHVTEFRIEVRTVRSMQHLHIEIEPVAELSSAEVASLVTDVSKRLRERLNFQAEVLAVEVGSLPRFELKGRRFFRVSSPE